MTHTTHHDYMSLALQLAERGRCSVSPNPMVGCVIVKNNQIIGQGWHQHAGDCHAEIHALREAHHRAKNATVYVTLEPCCHFGKTPPCTEALIQAGIKNIYIACVDPNPLVNQKGIDALHAAGIAVHTGLMEKEAKKLNEIFFHFVTHQRPFVIAKWAMSLDGKTTTHPLDTREISGETARFHTHQLRQQVDAILIGANTARIDNPLLTVRFSSENDNMIKHPLRIILSRKGVFPHTLQIFNPTLPAKTILATTKKTPLDTIDNWILPEDTKGNVCLYSLLLKLGQSSITSVLVEGGMSLLQSFFRHQLINKVHVHVAPTIIGDMEKKHSLINFTNFPLGEDMHFSADYQENTHV